MLLLVAALVISLLEGVPGRLPGVALGSEVLLHVERAVEDLQGQVDGLQAGLDRIGQLVLGDDEPKG